MAKYQGHRSWNAWNVSLWINNDEGLYNMARDYYEEGRRRAERKGYGDNYARRWAAAQFVLDMSGCKTPDGGVYNVFCVMRAMDGMLE